MIKAHNTITKTLTKIKMKSENKNKKCINKLFRLLNTITNSNS